jgi:hypothetical protein
VSYGSHYLVKGFFVTEQSFIIQQRNLGDSYVGKWSASIKDRTFGGGGGVSIRDVGSLSASLSGGNTGLFVKSEFR